MEPVLGEQDATVITVSGAVNEATLILEEADSWMESGMEAEGETAPPPASVAEDAEEEPSAGQKQEGGEAPAAGGSGRRTVLWWVLAVGLVAVALVVWFTLHG